MKALLLILLSLIATNLSAFQANSTNTTIELEIYSTDFPGSKNSLNRLIKQIKADINRYEENKSYLKVTFTTNEAGNNKLDSLLRHLGFIKSKKVNSVSNAVKIEELNIQKKYLSDKKISYAAILNEVKEDKTTYLKLWETIKSIEDSLYVLEKEPLKYTATIDTFEVNLDLYDDVLKPEYTSVDLINMPGVEYSFLKIENPGLGISADLYHGFFIKYLFTKGKSFATIGVYKNASVAESDTTTYNEIFTIGIGQDFYSKYLGRGSRTFLNLYSGYTAGVLVASGVSTGKEIFYLAPSIGIELFKNKYILLDSKVTYFIPFIDNRNLRGLSLNTSFNFVF